MEKKSKFELSRRGFLGSAAAVAALSVIPLSYSCSSESTSSVADDGKPNSKFGGVQIGTITYSFRGLSGVEETLQACVDAGVSSIELMGNGVEEYLGAPSNPVQRSFGGFGGFGGGAPGGAAPGGAAPGGAAPGGAAPGGAAPGGAAPGGAAPGGAAPQQQMRRFEPEPLTPEQEAQQAAYETELAAWRSDPGTMAKWEELGQKFRDAGVDIHIFKWTAGNTDELLDYSFQAAKALGALAICTEMSEESAQLMGPAAERNGMLAVYHNHSQYHDMTIADIERLLNYSPANRLNWDCGHYFGAGYDSTGEYDNIKFLEHFASQGKILSIHLKDKTSLENETESNQNQVWGQGETPLAEVLKYVQSNYPEIYCDIELEYQVKPWSDSVKEVHNCVMFAKAILL